MNLVNVPPPTTSQGETAFFTANINILHRNNDVNMDNNDVNIDNNVYELLGFIRKSFILSSDNKNELNVSITNTRVLFIS